MFKAEPRNPPQARLLARSNRFVWWCCLHSGALRDGCKSLRPLGAVWWCVLKIDAGGFCFHGRQASSNRPQRGCLGSDAGPQQGTSKKGLDQIERTCVCAASCAPMPVWNTPWFCHLGQPGCFVLLPTQHSLHSRTTNTAGDEADQDRQPPPRQAPGAADTRGQSVGSFFFGEGSPRAGMNAAAPPSGAASAPPRRRSGWRCWSQHTTHRCAAQAMQNAPGESPPGPAIRCPHSPHLGMSFPPTLVRVLCRSSAT